jgi:hypothetical protein
MNWAHLHLALNHIPVVGLGFGLVVFGIGLAKKHRVVQRTGLGLLIASALLTIPVYLTGEPAEEQVEQVAGISEDLIEQHEDAAKVSFIAVGVLGVVALGGLLLSRRGANLPPWLGILILLLSFGVSGSMAWTANLGGRIHHPEIRSDAAVTTASNEADEGPGDTLLSDHRSRHEAHNDD